MASKGSEFGGQPGRIAPLPHTLSAAETARLQRAIDPDPDTAGDVRAGVHDPLKVNTVEEQRLIDAGKRGLGPVDKAGNL